MTDSLPPPDAGDQDADERRPDGHAPEAVRATITLLQRRGIEAEVLIPLIRNMEREFGREAAHRIARETIEEIAREQGRAVAEALQRCDLEGFHHVKDTWSGAGGDLIIETLREDAQALEFNVTGCRFAEMYRRMGAEDLGFILSCSRDFALSEGYSDALQLERRQTIMQGAPFCDFRYRLAADGARSPAAPAADRSARAPVAFAANDPGETPDGGDAPEPASSEQEQLAARAERVGGMLGRMARDLAARAKPEAERRARQARAAAEAARPHLERAAQQAREYVETHDEEIKRVAGTGARVAADRIIPATLRPIVTAAQQELQRRESSAPQTAQTGEAGAEVRRTEDGPEAETPRTETTPEAGDPPPSRG